MDAHVAIASSLPSERADELKKPSAWTQPVVTALLALLAILMHLVLRYVYEFPRIICQGPLMVALVAGGVPLISRLMRKLFHREFGSDQLAGVSIFAAVILGEYLVG